MDEQTYHNAVQNLQADHRVADTNNGILRGSFIRTVNFHSTAAVNRDRYEKQLAFFSR